MSKIPKFKIAIGGNTVAARSGRWMSVTNPATSQSIGKVPACGPADADLAVQAAMGAFTGFLPPNRQEQLRAFVALLKANAKFIAGQDTACSGAPLGYRIGELRKVTSESEFLIEAMDKIFEPRDVPIGAFPGMQGRIDRLPVGPVLILGPNNYPSMLPLRPLVAALAAGCAVVMKPASETPLPVIEIGRLAQEVFGPGVVNVVTGSSNVLKRRLVNHAGIKRISFTGSLANGRALWKSLDYPKRMSCELAGNNGLLVLPGANLVRVILDAIVAALYNAGQSCDSRMIFVHESQLDELVQLLVTAVERLKVGDPMARETKIGSMLSHNQRRRVMRLFQEAQADGFELVTGGYIPTGPEFDNGAFLMPAVLVGRQPDAMTKAIVNEEKFGPGVVVVPYNNVHDIINWMNRNPYRLVATVMGPDEWAQEIASQICVGVVTVNQPITVFAGLPFGGFDESGWDRTSDASAIETFTELRATVTSLSEESIDLFGLADKPSAA